VACSPEQLAADINRIGAWLAQDDFAGEGPGAELLREIDVIALLGNQVIATLTAACQLAQRSPSAALVFSGGVGHSTRLLYENLVRSPYAPLVRDGVVRETMAEGEMYAAVAERFFQIPLRQIRVENQSRNSGENCRFSQRMLCEAGRPQQRILILQDPTMQRRSVLTWAREAETAGLGAVQILSYVPFVPRVECGADGKLRFPASQPTETWTMERFLALIMGEIRRLHDDENGYGPKGQGFLPHVDIPVAVLESHERLSRSSLATLAVR
jgi:uncharacterized SAM-binding protein YcdF (DUF218 family)